MCIRDRCLHHRSNRVGEPQGHFRSFSRHKPGRTFQCIYRQARWPRPISCSLKRPRLPGALPQFQSRLEANFPALLRQRPCRETGKYAVTLKQQLRCNKPELFNQIVDELAEEGMLVKETGRNGGLILARIAVENSTTGAFGSALEKAEYA